MKPDKLEKFILENREQFDNLKPNPNVWEAIKGRNKPVRTLSWQKVVWQLAAAVAIFLASWWIHDLVQEPERAPVASGSLILEPPDENLQVLLEAEVYYSSRISQAKEDVYNLSGGDENLMEMVNSDLAELEYVFQELKNDLKDEGDNQEVVEAMIQNYRLKLRILEDMQQQMKKVKDPNQKSDRNEI